MRALAPALLAAILLASGGMSAVCAQGARDGAKPTEIPAAISASGNDANSERLRRIISPHIEGDTLIIEGEIDSHIYDYLQYEAAKIAPLKFIALNSFGGNNDWALEIARKVGELGKITIIAEGDFCASACVYIFAAGRERIASQDAWIGVHGARLGAGYLTSFEGLCFVDLDQGSVFEPRKRGCREFLAHWRDVAMASTNAAFDMMEANGVSPELRQTYYAMPDDPDWPANLNVMRKPDWQLSAADAQKYNLVTEALPRTSY